MNRSNTAQQSIDEAIREVLAANGRIVLAVLFGSMADLPVRARSFEAGITGAQDFWDRITEMETGGLTPFLKIAKHNPSCHGLNPCV